MNAHTPTGAPSMSNPSDAREQLSAFMDGELPGDAARFLIKRCGTDAELAGCWERWHVTGELLRGGQVTPMAMRIDLVRAVSEALDADAAPVAVRVSGSVGRTALRWGGGFAVAASVALAALIVVQPTAVPEPASLVDNPSSPAQAILPVGSVSDATVAQSALSERDLRPPYRLDAQTVSNDGSMPHRHLGFDPRIESYLRRENGLRLQPQARLQVQPVILPLRAPVQDEARIPETVD